MANPIPASGLGSGLDVTGLVSQLMSVEQKPLTDIQTKQAAVNVKISAYGTFKSSLSSLRASLAGLQNNASYSTMSAKVDDSSVASVSAGATADVGAHSLEVTQLAAANRLKSGTFANVTDPVGTGTLTIQYGTVGKNPDNSTNFTVNGSAPTNNIVIDAAHNSLAGVRDAINQSNAGVSASIVNDGTGFRLVMTAKNTGTANSISVTAADDDGNSTDLAGLSKIAYNPTATPAAGGVTEVSASKDSKFLLDGIAITKSGNSVDDALSGVTLNLTKVNSGTPTNFTVGKDTSTIKKAIDSFVSAYNDLDKTVDTLTAYDPKTNKAGDLNGDAGVRNTYEQIRSSLTKMVNAAPGGYSALAQIGITVDRTGQLQVDSTKLQAALDKDPSAVQGLFSTGGKTSDPLVSFSKASTTAKAGQYPLNITQLATQGNAVGTTAAPLTIDSSNNTLSLKIDGVTSSIALTPKTYASATDLANELQAQINGNTAFSSNKVTVGVKADSNGVLSITSNRFGSASLVELTGNNVSTLFGSVTSTTGVDVAGNFGNGVTTGNGQELTSADGLTVKITGGALGDRGNVNYMRGIAVDLDTLIGNAVDGKGTIPSQIQSLQDQDKDLDKQTVDVQARLDAKEAAYKAQFTSLDEMITNMQSQLSYMNQQLGGLSK